MIWINILLCPMELLFISGINFNSLSYASISRAVIITSLVGINHPTEQMFAEHASFVERPCAQKGPRRGAEITTSWILAVHRSRVCSVLICPRGSEGTTAGRCARPTRPLSCSKNPREGFSVRKLKPTFRVWLG